VARVDDGILEEGNPMSDRSSGAVLRLALSLLALAALPGLAGCTSTGTGPPPAPEVRAYRLGSPDKLKITVIPDPVIEREVIVRPDGKISIDLIGDVNAAGRTNDEVAADIQSQISRYKRDAHVTVALAEALSDEITVLGEVFRPSTFPLSRQTRLVEAIGTVGGATTFAAKGRLRLIRTQEGQTKVFKVDLGNIQKGDLATNYVLQGGDLIYVPPGIMATIGYQLQALLFPFQQLIGFGANVTTKVFTGGL
jgi:polysaccharide biosynthesis/export protein